MLSEVAHSHEAKGVDDVLSACQDVAALAAIRGTILRRPEGMNQTTETI